jgi:hypothetical protein
MLRRFSEGRGLPRAVQRDRAAARQNHFRIDVREFALGIRRDGHDVAIRADGFQQRANSHRKVVAVADPQAQDVRRSVQRLVAVHIAREADVAVPPIEDGLRFAGPVVGRHSRAAENLRREFVNFRILLALGN